MEKMINTLFVTGMYRSGTTLISRLLNSQDNILSVSDPIRPVFNAYRSELLQTYCGKFLDPCSSLADYFLDSYDYLLELEKSEFKENISISSQQTLVNRIAARCLEFSPIYSKFIQKNRIELEAKRKWKDFVETLIGMMTKAYQKENLHTHLLSFKEVWSIEMAFPLLNAFKENIKVCFIIRDPRSVVSSSKIGAGNYPIIYLARQWRKQFLISKWLKEKYPNNIIVIKYEDLCSNTHDILNSVIDFSCEKQFSREFTNLVPKSEDENANWIQNSSYGNKNETVTNTRSIEAWRQHLTQNEILWTEALTYLHDSPYHMGANDISFYNSIDIETYPRRDLKKVSNWIVNICDQLEQKNLVDQLNYEHMRLKMIKNGLVIEPNKMRVIYHV